MNLASDFIKCVEQKCGVTLKDKLLDLQNMARTRKNTIATHSNYHIHKSIYVMWSKLVQYMKATQKFSYNPNWTVNNTVFMEYLLDKIDNMTAQIYLL